MAHEVSWTQYQEEKRDKGGIKLAMDDGRTFFIPPPELWPDDVASMSDPADIGRRLMGDDDFKVFCADYGGSGTVIASLVRDTLGKTLGESPAS